MKHPLLTLTNIATGIVLISLVACVAMFQKEHDTLAPPFSTRVKTVTRNLLPEQFIPHVTFGFNNLITDIYWIRAVQDFTAWDGKNKFYLNYFRNISSLDPTFEYPYLFSILIVPTNKDVDTLNDIASIAERGIAAIPTSWKIPFYLGTQYFLFTQNYNPAEKYLAIAASKKDAPDGVYLVYSTYVAKKAPKRIRSQEDFETAQNLVKVIYNNTDNETIKKMASKGLQENFINQMLQKGITAYKERYKKYPSRVEDMLAVNFISFPQEFLDAFTIEINQNDGSFRVVEKAQE